MLQIVLADTLASSRSHKQQQATTGISGNTGMLVFETNKTFVLECSKNHTQNTIQNKHSNNNDS
uniref:Uncharacterized protein n=1 Tax=Arion vulgaris TaxID=1028688 RepID=A0A0B7A5J8_9EUPU